MPMTENERRSEYAFRTTLYYSQIRGEEDPDGEEAITDLMVDLLHLCGEYGCDAETMHARIWRHYTAEREARLKPGARVRIHPGGSEYRHLAGKLATIARELGDDERDEEVGRMFEVTVDPPTGRRLHVFADECEAI